jgi:Zn-dependent metalloprotease
MPTRKTATKQKSATKKKSTVKRSLGVSATSTEPGKSWNGLRAFSMHAFDETKAPIVAKLLDERASSPMFAMRGTANIGQLDPETAAQDYLRQTLQSKAVPGLVAPKSDGTVSEFKSLGTETIPLTATKTVKFRQTLNKIPVYGSLVTVELDDANNLVSINSSLGEPERVSPVAKVAPSQAVKAVQEYPGFKKELANIVPHLTYYFDNGGARWHLAFILEDVPVTPESSSNRENKPAPRYMDYIVDAQTGRVITELPRTPSLASVVVNEVDGQGKPRQIRVETSGSKKTLLDTSLNVQTFDFNFGDPAANEKGLPGGSIGSPPKWDPSAVSAHANAAAVAEFLRNVLSRNNIDNKGGPLNSSINCVVRKESRDGRQWFNAYWNGSQMVYGQRLNGSRLLSLSIDLDVVGHEMFHGVTDFTARLEYVNQSGAMNESYSDIFGVIIANFSNPDTRTWSWKIGEGLSPDGKPFRDMKDPTLFDQPANMKNFKLLPSTENGDWGGVHTNSGIHNKAAYNILTAEDGAGNLALTPKEVAAIFYLALTQQLSRSSQFSDSRRGVISSARSLFRTLPSDQQKLKLDAIASGFSAVGIV